MKLTDLEPQWIIRNGERVGILFLCPHCVGTTPRTHLTCFKASPPNIAGDDPDSQYGLIAQLLPADEVHNFVPCARGTSWKFVGDTFDTLSVTPSLDASASGHWHGFVTNGEIV